MKRCLSSLIIKETQNHTEIIPHNLEWLLSRKKHEWGYGYIGMFVHGWECKMFVHCVVGNVKWYSWNEKQYGIFLEIKKKKTGFSISTSGHMSK